MKEKVINKHSDEYFFSSERCFITEISNSPDDPDVSIAKARVEPGMTTAWHRLKETTERYFILSGTGQVEIAESSAQKVEAGSVVIIPPMCRQRITNNGKVDLIFLAICSPRFTNQCYENLDES